MVNQHPKLVTKQGIVVDIVLALLFWCFLMTPKFGSFTNPVGIKKHVPWTEAPEWVIWLSAGYCAACLAGVAWMALCLFRVTLVDQLALAGNKEQK